MPMDRWNRLQCGECGGHFSSDMMNGHLCLACTPAPRICHGCEDKSASMAQLKEENARLRSELTRANSKGFGG